MSLREWTDSPMPSHVARQPVRTCATTLVRVSCGSSSGCYACYAGWCRGAADTCATGRAGERAVVRFKPPGRGAVRARAGRGRRAAEFGTCHLHL
eukprot:1476035-Prymnesium_polylepis.1